jgi:hypothetical protein
MAVEGQRGGKEVEQEIEDEEIVAALYKYGGAFSLVGLWFYHKARKDAPEIKVKLDGLLRDGEQYRATDVRTGRPLEDGFQPRELRVKKGSRGKRDPVILLMRRLRMNLTAYLDPLLAERPASRMGEYSTSEPQFGQHADERRTCMPQHIGEQGREFQMGGIGEGGRGRSNTPLQRNLMTPSPQRNPFQFGQPVGQGYQQGFRPVHSTAFGPLMHGGG